MPTTGSERATRVFRRPPTEGGRGPQAEPNVSSRNGPRRRASRPAGGAEHRVDDSYVDPSSRPAATAATTTRRSRTNPAISARTVGAGTPSGTLRPRVLSDARGDEALGKELPHVRHGNGKTDRESLAQKPRPAHRELVAQPIDVGDLALGQTQLDDSIERLQIRIVERHGQHLNGVERHDHARTRRSAHGVERNPLRPDAGKPRIRREARCVARHLRTRHLPRQPTGAS